MISMKLVAMIEDHAEQLTAGLVTQLQQHPRTDRYHGLPLAELHDRAYEVYRNLSKWIQRESESEVEASYHSLGRQRRAEGIPLSQVVFSLMLTQEHLLNYVKYAGLSDTALELYQELDLVRVVTQFFDRAIYYTAQGYETAAHP